MTSDLHHLAAAYALDALDDDERREFEAHYPSCEVCSAEVADFRSTAAALAESTQMAPPPELKARVLAEISQTRQISPIVPDRVVDLAERRRRNAPRSILLAVAAAAVVAVVGGIAALRLDRSSDFEQLVAAPDAITTTLEGTEAASGGAVRVVWSADRDEVAVIGDQLPDPGDGMAYQLWFVLDDESVASAGVFGRSGGAVSEVIDVGDIIGSGWGVTIEPEAGSDQPTSNLVYAGAI